MPTVYRPRRPRASPLWQIIHHGWDEFQSQYESSYRKAHGPLRPEAVEVIEKFYRCGDLAQGFTRFHCPDCGHEKLLAFTCKTRGYCPCCHQRKVIQTADWIASSVCFNVPHRQIVFTIPKVLRAIFRKRRKLLTFLFHVSIESLRDWMRTRLDLPGGQLAAIAAVQTFGDYLGFHPHLHVLCATGLVDSENRFHLMPDETLDPLIELFRHRFIETLVREKLLSRKKADQMLTWKHSGFSLDAGDKPVSSYNIAGRRNLAEYMLRAPFSLEKVTWNEKAKKVIYRSKRSWHTKQNFQVFTAADFIASTVEHIPPKSQQTIRYYGRYSNKRRGWDFKHSVRPPLMAPQLNVEERKQPIRQPETLFILPAPEPKSHRALRPLWRDLILKTWGEDPQRCPCCRGKMKNVGTIVKKEEIEFFLLLHGLWEGIISLPPPPDPPYDIETMEPLDVPIHWSWSDQTDPPPEDWWQDTPGEWEAPELPLDDGYTLVLDGDAPHELADFPTFSVG